jgi:RNA polymerase sigma-70 factor (ECF subfamily)
MDMSMEETNKMNGAGVDVMALVETHIDRLHRYAMIRVRDTSVAEDLVQETLLAAIQSAGRFSGLSSVGTWLTGILKHKIIDHYREHRFFVDQDDLEELFDETGHWRHDAIPLSWTARTPEEDLQTKQLAVVLRQALGALPRPLSTVFTLREIEGLERTEICQLLGLSESNYWTILHRARLRLRREIEGRLQISSPSFGATLAHAAELA